jgi:hypothetical protein
VSRRSKNAVALSGGREHSVYFEQDIVGRSGRRRAGLPDAAEAHPDRFVNRPMLEQEAIALVESKEASAGPPELPR